jgi:hypothetical protein
MEEGELKASGGAGAEVGRGDQQRGSWRVPADISGMASSSGLHGFGRGGAMVVGFVVEEAHMRSSRLQWRALGQRRRA